MYFNPAIENFHPIKVKKVLLIDDDSITNYLNKMVIEQESFGCDVFVLEKAHAVIEVIDDIKPDVIFLDIHMPLFDGWDVLNALNENNCELPVFMLSSSIDIEDKDKSFNYKNVYGFISKPLNAPDLGQILEL